MIQEAEYKKQNTLLAQIFCPAQIWARRFSSRQVLAGQIDLGKIWARYLSKIWARECRRDSGNRTEVRPEQEELAKICTRTEAFNI